MNKRLIGALVVAIIAVAGWYWTQGQITKAPVSASVAGTSPPVAGTRMAEVVVPAELSAQADQGETYYNAVCASCHGTNAAGQDGVAPPWSIAFMSHRITETALSFWQRGMACGRITGNSATCPRSLRR